MKKLLLLPFLFLLSCSEDGLIMENGSYKWYEDRIEQGEYLGVAETPYRIVSNHDGDTLVWECRNDLSAMPDLSTPFLLEEAVYNMGLDECINAVEPDSTLRTGLSWGEVWTRDVSYSTILSMAYMQPRAAMISLLCKIGRNGQIIQDTGTGGAWPCSSDREVWTVAAWELYKVTGDREWLAQAYPVSKKSLSVDMMTLYDSVTGLVRGESSFIDWREQSYPRWMEPADIYDSRCLGTNMVHYAALLSAAEMAGLCEDPEFRQQCLEKAASLKEAINRHLWMDDCGYYAQFIAGRKDDLVYTKSETLGQALAILYGVADGARAERLSESMPVVDYGAPVFWPWIPDIPPYHNRAVWPFVQSFWMHASAMTGNEQGVLHSIGSLYRAAAMFATNKENFVADSGDWKGTQINSSNMLWSLSGALSVTFRVLFGISYGTDALHFAPVVPEKLAADRMLEGFRYRGMTLDMQVSGYGDVISSFELDGVRQAEPVVPADLTGRHEVKIVMADRFRKNLSVNMQPGMNTPMQTTAELRNGKLVWTPVGDAATYRIYAGGNLVAEVSETEACIADGWTGDLQVVAVTAGGVASFPSEPIFLGEKVEKTFPPVMLTMKSGNAFTVEVEVPYDGLWFLSWNYANGNGDITTDRKCAIRTLSADGQRVDVNVFPQRGVDAWDDWGWTSPVAIDLKEGKHVLTLSYMPENENMHLDVNDFSVRGLTLCRTH